MIDLFGTCALISVSLILYVYWFFKKSHSYFDRINFPALKPTFILGNVGDALLLRKSLSMNIYDLYNQMGSNQFSGFYIVSRPFVLIKDPELIKAVFISDFENFQDRGVLYHKEIDPLYDNVSLVKGDRWKPLRRKLNSAFTIGKIKTMFPLMQECARELGNSLDQVNGEDFDINYLVTKYSIDAIGNCAFGIEIRKMDDLCAEFTKIEQAVFKFRYQAVIRQIFPKLPISFAKFFNLKYQDVQVEHFFVKLVKAIVKYREDHRIKRDDVLNLLLTMKNENDKRTDPAEFEEFSSKMGNIEMTEQYLIANCAIFFVSGFQTSSTTISLLMLELALNESIQSRVREEILKIFKTNAGSWTYEDLRCMTYTDMVIAETLRKYPPLPFLGRVCKKSYRIPNSEIVIPTKTPVTISVYGLHMDSKYYERPHEFYPEHFTKEAICKRPFCAYMPFGEGPRMCIGKQFADMELKLALIYLLKNYSFQVSSKMKLPVTYTHQLQVGSAMPKDGILLKCQKI